MSIFPKRTLVGSSVTIHWNFNTSKLEAAHIFPFVRIGVKDPLGKITMLFEQYVLALPAIKDNPTPTPTPKLLYLNKNTPLLIMASYLSGQHQREKLIDILQNIQAGKHYYFTYAIPLGAPLGKYTILSEVYNNGEIKYSTTAADDFFFVEEITVDYVRYKGKLGTALLKNHSPEPTPVKIIEYHPGMALCASQVKVFEIPGHSEYPITFKAKHSFMSYNEERKLVPLQSENIVCIRNPYYLPLYKPDGNKECTYIMHRETEECYILRDQEKLLWEMADGITHRSALRAPELHAHYDEMLDRQLIKEISIK